MDLKEDFTVMMQMAALSRYSQTHLMKSESVLEHTGFVTLMCLIIALRLTRSGEQIDIGLLLMRAASHDMDEIITGDIPMPTKYYNEGIREALNEIEKENMMLISRKICDDEILYELWNEAKDGKTGLIVGLADALAVVYKAWHECIMLGNKTIIDHTVKLHSALAKKRELVDKYFLQGSHTLKKMIDEAMAICIEIQDYK